jgi:hypothetical protein
MYVYMVYTTDHLKNEHDILNTIASVAFSQAP